MGSDVFSLNTFISILVLARLFVGGIFGRKLSTAVFGALKLIVAATVVGVVDLISPPRLLATAPS